MNQNPISAGPTFISADAVAVRIIEDFDPARVLHFGCTDDSLVEALRRRGIDATSLAIDTGPDAKRLGQNEAFDVVVLENLSQLPSGDAAQNTIRALCDSTDEILFAPYDDFRNPAAINIQTAADLAELFATFDFHPVLHHTPGYLGATATHFRKVSRRIRVAIFSREEPDWAVSRIRLLDPLRQLEAQGRMSVTFISRSNDQIPVDDILDADIWVIHREFADRDYSNGLIEAAHLLEKPVVFEIDDLVTHLPLRNPMRSYAHRVTPDVLSAIRGSDFVTTSTSTLLEELATDEPSIRARGVVIPNSINTALWGEQPKTAVRSNPDTIVVGWFGSSFHEDDLGLVRDAIVYLTRKYGSGIRFDFHGYLPSFLKDLKGVRLAQKESTSMAKYIAAARNAEVHIGIAPLLDHRFNHAKSDMKWLEYAISGIPGIYSNVGAYRNSVDHGTTGLLVDNSTRSWVAAIERMIADPALRRRISRAAFDVVSTTRTVIDNATRWDRAYRSFVASGMWAELNPEPDEQLARRRVHAWSLLMQAANQQRGGRFSDCAETVTQAITIDPTITDEVLQIAASLEQAGALSGAERSLRGLVENGIERTRGSIALARFHQRNDNPWQAEQTLIRAAEQTGNDAHLVDALVPLLLDRGDYPAICDWMKKAVASASPDQIIAHVQTLITLGQLDTAKEIVDAASDLHRELDFTPLRRALAHSPAHTPAANVASSVPTIAVYTSGPLTQRQTMLRLRAPLRVLETMGMAQTIYCDGVINADAIEKADVLIIHRDFARLNVATPLIERARERGIPVVLDLDDLPYERLALIGDDESAATVREEIFTLIENIDATIVSTSALRDAILPHCPAAANRIVVIETPLDTSHWNQVQNAIDSSDAPFEIGVFTDWATPTEIGELLEGIAPVLSRRGRSVNLTAWSPRHEPNSLSGSTATSAMLSATHHYAEYANNLRTQSLDLALVPVSNHPYFTTLSDDVWCELAACRVPMLFSARDPFLGSVIHGSTGLMIPDGAQTWHQFTEEMLQCPSLRHSIADRSWTLVIGERTVQSRATIWGELFAALLSVDEGSESLPKTTPVVVAEQAAN